MIKTLKTQGDAGIPITDLRIIFSNQAPNADRVIAFLELREQMSSTKNSTAPGNSVNDGGYGSNSLTLGSLLIVFLTIHKCCTQRIGPSQAIYFIFIYTTLFIYFTAVAFSPNLEDSDELTNTNNKTGTNDNRNETSRFWKFLNPNPWFWSRTFTPMLHSTGTYYASLMYFAFDGLSFSQTEDTSSCQTLGQLFLLTFLYLILRSMVTIFLILIVYPYDFLLTCGKPLLFIIFIAVMVQVLAAKSGQIKHHQPEQIKAKRDILRIKKIMILLGMQCLVASFYVLSRTNAYNFNSAAEGFLMISPVAQCVLLYVLATNLTSPNPANSGRYARVQQPTRAMEKSISMTNSKRLDTIISDGSSQVTAESGLYTPIRRDSNDSFEHVPNFSSDIELNLDVSGLNTPVRQGTLDFEQVPEFTLVNDMQFKFEGPSTPVRYVSYECFAEFEPTNACNEMDLNVTGVDTPIRRASNECFDSMVPAFTAGEFGSSWSEPHTPIRRVSMEYFDRIPSILAASALAEAELRTRRKNNKKKLFVGRKVKSLMTID